MLRMTRPRGWITTSLLLLSCAGDQSLLRRFKQPVAVTVTADIRDSTSTIVYLVDDEEKALWAFDAVTLREIDLSPTDPANPYLALDEIDDSIAFVAASKNGQYIYLATFAGNDVGALYQVDVQVSPETDAAGDPLLMAALVDLDLADAAIDPLPLTSSPTDLIAHPTDDKLYLSLPNRGSVDPPEVVVIDAMTTATLATIDLGNGLPGRFAFSSDLQWLAVANREEDATAAGFGELFLIDPTTDTLAQRLDVGVPTQAVVVDVAADAANDQVYLARADQPKIVRVSRQSGAVIGDDVGSTVDSQTFIPCAGCAAEVGFDLVAVAALDEIARDQTVSMVYQGEIAAAASSAMVSGATEIIDDQLDFIALKVEVGDRVVVESGPDRGAEVEIGQLVDNHTLRLRTALDTSVTTVDYHLRVADGQWAITGSGTGFSAIRGVTGSWVVDGATDGSGIVGFVQTTDLAQRPAETDDRFELVTSHGARSAIDITGAVDQFLIPTETDQERLFYTNALGAIGAVDLRVGLPQNLAAATSAVIGIEFIDNGAESIGFLLDRLPSPVSGITRDETWDIELESDGLWTVMGSRSGQQQNRAQLNVPYVTDGGELRLTISENASAPVDSGDRFVVTTTDALNVNGAIGVPGIVVGRAPIDMVAAVLASLSDTRLYVVPSGEAYVAVVSTATNTRITTDIR